MHIRAFSSSRRGSKSFSTKVFRGGKKFAPTSRCAMTSLACSPSACCGVALLRTRPSELPPELARNWSELRVSWQPGRSFAETFPSLDCAWKTDREFHLCFRCVGVAWERRREKVGLAAVAAASSAVRWSAWAFSSAPGPTTALLPTEVEKDGECRPR